MGPARLDPACPGVARLRALHRDQSALLSGPALGQAVRRRQEEDLQRHARECPHCSALPEPVAPPPPPARRGLLRSLLDFFRPRPARAPPPAKAAPPAPKAKPAPAPRPAPAAAKPARAPVKAGAKKPPRHDAPAPKPAPKAAPKTAAQAPRAASAHAPPPEPTKGLGGIQRETKDPVARALSVLGLEPGADGKAVRKAYRERAILFHPDKVTHLPPDLRAMAEASMRDVNRAYETLQRLGRA
jgi:outer membrane biosynthesis protein TonB